MINLRYHVVSLVGVFLALAIGIAVGASVINQGLVQQQQDRLARIERNLDAKNGTISQLRTELSDAQGLYQQAEPRLLAGHLADTPVILAVSQGVDKALVAELSDRFAAAGASVAAEVWLSPRMKVDGAEDQRAVDTALGVSSGSPSTARYLLLQSLRGVLRKAGPVSVLAALDKAGLIDVRNERVGGAPMPPDARIVMLTSDGGDLPVSSVLLPMVTLLAADDPTRVVVAEMSAAEGSNAASTDGDNGTGTGSSSASSLVAAVRDTDALADRVSTVDHAESTVGRLATVLSVEDLAIGVVGRYGTAKGASRLLPASAP